MVSAFVWLALGQTATTLSDNADIVSPATAAVIGKLPDNYQLGKWPPFGSAGSRYWPNSRLPMKVKENATQWAQHTVAPSLLAADIGKRWRGIERFEEQDVAGARYVIGKQRVQITEDGGSFCLLVTLAISVAVPSKLAAETLLREQIIRICQFPVDKVSKMEIKIKDEHASSADVYYGALFCDFHTSYEDNSWWNDMTVVTDGKFVAIRFNEHLPGPPPTFGRATPGYQSRFRDGKQ